MKMCPYILASIDKYINYSEDALFGSISELNDFLSEIEFAEEWEELRSWIKDNEERDSLAELLLCRFDNCGRYYECKSGQEEK